MAEVAEAAEENAVSAGKRGRGRARILMWVGGGVALLATTLVVVDRGGSGPAEVWRSPATDSDVGDDVDLALWLDGSVLTRVAPTHVTGFDAEGGESLWEFGEPEEARAVCAASERTNAEGIGAVLYSVYGADGEEDCALLVVIDTRRGESLWTTDLREAAEWWGGGNAVVRVSASTVTVSDVSYTGLNSFHGFDLATGEPVPDPEPPTPDCPEYSTGVSLIGQADTRLAMVTTCEPVPDGEEPVSRLSVYDADSRELLWTRDGPDPDKPVTGVVSGSPLILLEGRHLVAYSDTGERLWRVVATDESGGTRLSVRAVTDGVLIVESLSDEGDRRGEFAGYDLGSGERLWQSQAPEPSEFFGVAGDTGSALLGAYAFDQDDGGRMTLSWLDLADGSTRDFGTVPFPLEGGEVGALVAFDEDRLYLTGGTEQEFRLRAFER